MLRIERIFEEDGIQRRARRLQPARARRHQLEGDHADRVSRMPRSASACSARLKGIERPRLGPGRRAASASTRSPTRTSSARTRRRPRAVHFLRFELDAADARARCARGAGVAARRRSSRTTGAQRRACARGARRARRGPELKPCRLRPCLLAAWQRCQAAGAERLGAARTRTPQAAGRRAGAAARRLRPRAAGRVRASAASERDFRFFVDPGSAERRQGTARALRARRAQRRAGVENVTYEGLRCAGRSTASTRSAGPTAPGAAARATGGRSRAIRAAQLDAATRVFLPAKRCRSARAPKAQQALQAGGHPGTREGFAGEPVRAVARAAPGCRGGSARARPRSRGSPRSRRGPAHDAPRLRG